MALSYKHNISSIVSMFINSFFLFGWLLAKCSILSMYLLILGNYILSFTIWLIESLYSLNLCQFGQSLILVILLLNVIINC